MIKPIQNFRKAILALVWLVALSCGLTLSAQTDSSDPQVLCVGSIDYYQVDYTENGGTGTTGSTYAWAITSGTFAGTLTPGQGPSGSTNRIEIDWGTSLPGPYVLQVIETSNGCPGAPMQLNIQLTPLVTPSFDAIGPLCLNSTATLLSTSTNGITGTWNPATINTTAIGTSTYTFTPDAGQCATTTTMDINITDPVTPLFTQVADICSGATLSALPNNSTNGISGSWSPALDNTTTTTYTFSPDAGQCASSTTMTINVNSSSTPLFTQIAAICSGDALAALPTTSTNGILGTWSPAVDNTTTTTYTFTADAGQCASTATMTITVNSSSAPLFTQVAAICSGDVLAALPTTSNNGISGTWSPAIDNSATTTYTFTPAAGQCASSTSMTITVNSPIVPLFTQVADFCSGATLSPLPVTSNNGITGTWSPSLDNTVSATYTFTPASGQCATSATMTINVTTPTTPTFNPVADACSGSSLTALPTTSLEGITGTWSPALNNTITTTYTFTPSAGQCASNKTLIITILDLPTAAIASGPTCSADLLTWSVDVTISAGTLTSTAGTVTNTSGNNYAVTGIPSGTSITLTVNESGCSNTLAIGAPNCDCPTVNAPVGTDASYCAGATIIPALTATVSAGQTINWYDAASGGNYLGSGSPFVPSGPGTFYAEAVDDATGCLSSTRDAVTLTENALPTIIAVGDASFCQGESTTLSASGAVSYAWSPSTGLSATTGTTVTATPSVGTIIYTVTGTDGNGCLGTDTVTITVNPLPTTSPIFHN